MTHLVPGSPGRTLRANGREYLYFGGTSYLGMATDPDFHRMLTDNISRCGSNHGASRTSNVRLSVYEKAEDWLAFWTGSEAALTLSSGYLAARLAVTAFLNTGYRAFYTPNAHAALLADGAQVYSDFDTLASDLKQHITEKKKETPVLFMDTVDLSHNGYPAFKMLQKLPLQDVVLVADDSHGLGIVGKDGAGAYGALMELEPKELLVCASLGKAMGIPGGVLLGSRELLEPLRRTPLFAGASPAPPAYLAAMLQAQGLYVEKRTRLKTNIHLFEKTLEQTTLFTFLPEYPVYAFADREISEYLLQNGVLVTFFDYAAAHESFLPGRIVLSAHHTTEDIRYLAQLLNGY